MPTHTPAPTSVSKSVKLLNFSLVLGGIILAGVILAGCTVPGSGPTPTPTTTPTLEVPSPTVAGTLTEARARAIASKSGNACGAVGTIGATETYNPTSQTWWFTITPSQPKAGCAPACVVSAQGQAEVNWRCTGLKPVQK